MKYHTPITISMLIQLIRHGDDQGESYCIYGAGDSDEITLESECFLAGYPTITESYEEIYPDFVKQKNLSLWFREELVQDVVANATHQLSNVTDDIILQAIKYYNERDCFMDIS